MTFDPQAWGANNDRRNELLCDANAQYLDALRLVVQLNIPITDAMRVEMSAHCTALSKIAGDCVRAIERVDCPDDIKQSLNVTIELSWQFLNEVLPLLRDLTARGLL